MEIDLVTAYRSDGRPIQRMQSSERGSRETTACRPGPLEARRHTRMPAEDSRHPTCIECVCRGYRRCEYASGLRAPSDLPPIFGTIVSAIRLVGVPVGLRTPIRQVRQAEPERGWWTDPHPSIVAELVRVPVPACTARPGRPPAAAPPAQASRPLPFSSDRTAAAA